MGVRCFVIEGGEAGGHISNLGGLTAWQEIFNEVREQSLQDKVHLILAGGIRGKEAKELLTALLNYYGFENTLKISLQLGSTYLATKQALDLTPIDVGFREQLFTVDDTFVTGESLSRGVRQLAIRNSEKTVLKEWRIFAADLTHEEKKQAYEKLYHGGLQRAISSKYLVETGSYMAGSVSALLDTQLSIDDIHLELLDPAPAQANEQTQEAIAIVGIGLKLPGAESVEEHFYNIFHQRCFISDMPEGNFDRELYLSVNKNEELTSYTSLGAFTGKLVDDLSRYRIPPIIASQISRSQKMALDASHKALNDAGYFEKPFNKERTAVIIGAGGGSNEESLNKINWPEIRSRLIGLSETGGIDIEDILNEYETRYLHKDITEDTRPGELANIIAARVASVFDFKGETHTVDAACAASLASITHAMCLLRNHSYDVVLAGGTEERMGKDAYIEFSRIGAVSENGCFPFDNTADGFVLGEGAVIYVLKRYTDALKFGDKIYAVINGWGASSDGAGKGITAPSKEGQMLAVKRAFQDAKITPSLVDYIECHATATRIGDSTEFEGLSEFLTTSLMDKKPVIGASKAMIGHLRTAAGAAGMLQSLFVINTRCFPATINFQNHSQGKRLPFDVLKIPKKVTHENKIFSSVSSFGFGGTNYHLVLSSPDENNALPLLSEQQMELPVYEFVGDLAWVCPGQGSQYEGMLAAYKDEPDFIDYAWQAATIFSQYSQVNLIRLLTEVDPASKDKNDELLKATEVSQPAIFFTSIIIGRKLLKLGIKPDLLMGHSLGEYSALYLADMLSFADAFRMVCLRGKLMSASLVKDSGAMIAIMGDESLAKKLIQATPHYAACANLNAYTQTVISCSKNALDDILKAADELKVRATVLKVARGFHSKFVSNCVDEMAQALESCQFYYPGCRVTANIKNQAYPYYSERSHQVMDKDDRSHTIALLKRQIDHPVHFISQIQSAYASGIRRFVEVGPNNILTHLIEQIHQGKYLQTIYVNKQAEKAFDFSTLATLLQEEISIKRVALPKRDVTQKKIRRKTSPIKATNQSSVIDEIRGVVARISGYELASFADNAEFERDLGIDTLKIFEILAQLRGNVLPEDLSNFRELNSVSKILAHCVQPEQMNKSEQASPLETIREIVASVSGYDLSMLDVNAEFERDLGIDTLKIFEIIAQLRGNILPDELTDFRNLKSIQNLYAARDLSQEALEAPAQLEKELVVYQYKQHRKKDVQVLRLNLKDFAIYADNGYANSTLKSLFKLLIFKVADCEDDLRNRVYPLLYNKTREFIEEKAEKIIYISYGTGGLEEASILSVAAFVKSVAKDYSDADWHYNHFSRLPDYTSLDKRISSGIGLHCLGDKVIQGKMQKMQGFQSERAQIPTQISAQDHIVVTGGARGIASHLVKKLYAVCQARFTLIGRKQSSEDWMQTLDSQRISYLAIDIADKKAVQQHQAHLSDCTILIHSAGIDHSKNFMHKSYDEFFEVIDVKVAGLFNLLGFMSAENIRALVLFSSTVGYRGNHGQADYAAANAVLNSKIGQFPCLSLAWTAWAEIGMASRGYIHDILSSKGARFIGLDEGSDIFQNALSSFLANPYATHSQLLIAAKIPEDDVLYCSESDAIHTIDDLDKAFIVEVTYDSRQFPELLDHQFNGQIFVPGSVILGSVLHEIHKKIQLDNLTIELDNVEFLSPLIVVENVPKRLKITRLTTGFLVEDIKQQLIIPIATFTVNLTADNPELNYAYIKTRFENTLPNLAISEYPCNRRYSELGEHFQILETISFSQGIIQTTMHLKAGNAELLQRLFAISKALEACFQSCSSTVHLLKNPKSVYLPSGLEKAVISFKTLQKTNVLRLYIELLESQSKGAVFNILAVNQHGEQIINIKAFTASPVFDVKASDYYIFKNTLIKDSLSEGFFADIDALNQGFSAASNLTANELNEINALNSSKRINEKKSGKIACKILSNWQSLCENKSTHYLSNTEVLSTDKPVQVLINGKPDANYPYYSISHSDSVIYVARSEYPIGVDIEKIRPLDELTIKNIYGHQRSAIDKFLHATDINTELQDLFPLIVFTQKEAALKAEGTGLANGTDLAVIKKFAVDNASINVNGKNYSVSTNIADHYVISKALLLTSEQAGQSPVIKLNTKQLTKYQQTLLQDEKQNKFSYSLNHIIEFNDVVDLDKLTAAINSLFAGHEVLRSRFPGDEGQVLIMPFIAQYFTVEESDETVDAIEERFINKYSNYQYDLENEALFQIKLYRTAEGTTLVLMNFHHLILDCYNAFILSETILKNYQQLIEGKTVTNNNHKQYYDMEIEATFKQGNSFWATYLLGVDTFKFARPKEKKHSSGKHFKTITHLNKKGLEYFCRTQSITLFVGLLGVLKRTFLKLYNKNDLVFLIPFSAKNSQNHHTLGSFIHLLPVRSKINQGDSNDVLFNSVRESLYTAIEHQDEQIDLSLLENNHGIITQLINSNNEDGLFNDTVKRRNTDGKNTHNPLILSFINFKDTIHLDVTFNADIVSKIQLGEILDCFQEELNAVMNTVFLEKVEVNYIAPSSAGEKMMILIWKEVFNIESIGVYDNFFDLGGHSLLAVVLRTKIEAKFNKFIPIELIFQFPTLSLLVQAVFDYNASENTNLDSIITPIQTEGSQPPFFWLNGGQVVPTMRELIGNDRPFYFLNHQSLNGKKAKYLTLSEIVDFYTQAIMKIDSTGPYFLGGFCIGGMLIYEIAQQLVALGKIVALLFLLDPVGGSLGKKHAVKKLTLASSSPYRKYKKIEPLLIFLKKCNRMKSKLCHKINDIKVQAYFSIGKPLPADLIWPYQLSFYKVVSLNYQPKLPFAGINKIILIQDNNANPELWASIVKNRAEVHVINATHLELMENPYNIEWINILVDAMANN